MAQVNGEAPAPKEPAPPRALISNIKSPKGAAGGFTSHRQDQTCSRGGGMDQNDGDHLLSWQAYRIIPVAYMLHHTLQTIFDHKHRVSTEKISTATVYFLFHKITDIKLLERQSDCSLSS